MVICLERDAHLHTAQLMALPLTVSCSSKIQIGFTFLVPAHPGSPGQRAVKRVCVCVTMGWEMSPKTGLTPTHSPRYICNNRPCLCTACTGWRRGVVVRWCSSHERS